MWKKDKKEKSFKKGKPFSKSEKTGRNLKLALLALLLLGMLLILGKAFQFLSDFQKPFYVLNTKAREYTWNGDSVLNLVVAKTEKDNAGSDLKQLNFVSLNPKEEEITVIKLSDEVFLDVPKNFGFWKLGSIYKLGQENRPAIGEDLLKMSVSRMLALPVDGILEIETDRDLDIVKEIESWKSNIFTGFSFLTRVKTDLSLKEAMDFVSQASKVRQDKITSLDLLRSAITSSKLLPDSSRVLGVDGVKLDTFIKQNLNDPALSQEDLTVAVFNGTDHPGLTSAAVRMINNLGARVTIISNTSEKFVKNGIYINPREGESIDKSRTYKRLSEVFAPNCLQDNCRTSDIEVLNSRAAINLVLGEEYFNYWSSR